MRARFRRWKKYLFPEQETTDPSFRDEVKRLSVIGLGVIACICFAGPAFMLLATGLLVLLGLQSRIWIVPDLAIMTAGALGLSALALRPLRRFARGVGCMVGYSVALVFILTAALAPDAFRGAGYMGPHNMTLVMLVGIAALPVRPMHMLALGLSMLASYAATVALFPARVFVPEVTPLFLASLVVIVLICTGLTAVVYHQRAEAFQARERLLHAQAKTALAESAAAQSRLAAALSHELNSPIGVVRSSLDTLALLVEKHAAGRASPERVIETIRELSAPADQSCRRLADIVERMQRFTNLDRAQEAAVDINRLLEDTVEVLRPELEERARMAMSLSPVPRLRCRPRQMSALFSNLLLNSAAAVGEDGSIRVRSFAEGASIVVELEDNGRGIPGSELEHIFEPAFTVDGGRVSTTNWGLFNCRNIVAGLGGEIRIRSQEGSGTVVRVELPASRSSDRR
jgi:signal transduction histidine kinase